jgi:hypothetical protein
VDGGWSAGPSHDWHALHLLLHKHSSHLGISCGLLHHVIVLDHDVVLQLQLRLRTLRKIDLLLGRLGCLLLLQDLVLALKEPLVIAGHLGLGRVERCILEVGTIFADLQLLRVHHLILAVHLPHLFNLVKIDNETSLVRVVFFNTFAAKDGQMIRTVKMLNTLIMFFTEQAVDAFFVFEVDVAQYWISLDYLIQYVEVQRQLIDRFNLLDKFAADRAPDSEIVVQLSQTLRAEGVSAMD